MRYTAKKLASLSGVSVRTLHWYDEVGLLKPASYGEENGYRYYDRKQLLTLQNILFFRELGFKLEEIEKIMNSRNFDQVQALRTHQEQLELKIQRTKELIKTIKKTITDLEGGKKMKDQQLYTGFYDWAEKQPTNAYAIVNTNDPSCEQSAAEKLVLGNLKKVDTTSWTKEDWEKHANVGNSIYAELTGKLKAGVKAKDPSVQKLIAKHHAYTEKFHDLKAGVYEALAELYRLNPNFRGQLDRHHKLLGDFISEAMVEFVKSKKM